MAATLSANRRTIVGKQVRGLRRQGLLPAVIYGHMIEPVSISLNAREASTLLPTLTSTQFVEIVIDEKPHNVLVREKQRHPIDGHLLHVDFQEVSMLERFRANVQLDFFGEAPAVKFYNGVVVIHLEELDIEALPADLPERIKVDLGSLTEIGSAIRVRDLILPAEVEVLENMDDIVVVVTPPVAEEVVVSEGATAEPEVIEKGKKEEDF
jgi:large subunit ribosomal protein L25